MRIETVEDMDWGGARTRQSVLLSGRTCWSQSVFPCRLGSWHWIPNRDYPYQGLTHVLDTGENWKFLDGLGIGVEGVNLSPKEAIITPEVAEYAYKLSGGDNETVLSITFRIDPKTDSGVVEIQAFAGLGSERNISFMPLVDIRHMYAASNPFAHRAGSAKSAILAERDGKIVAVKRMHGPAITITAGHVLDWDYKLGSGFREQTPAGIKFIGERRSVFVPGTLVFPITEGECYEVRVLFDENDSRDKPQPMQRKKQLQDVLNLGQMDALVRTYVSSDLERESLVGRIFGASRMIASFGSRLPRMPYAGEWWFKTPWFRDAYEGMLNNLQTYHLLGLDRIIEDSVLFGLAFQDATGRVPNRISEQHAEDGGGARVIYESVDATLLGLMLGLEYARLSGKNGFLSKVLTGLDKMILSFINNGKTGAGAKENGPPILSEETYLISCVPWQSWTDSRPYGIPSRVPKQWEVDAGVGCLSKPTFLLPEINAQFLRVLHLAINCGGITTRRKEALQKLFDLGCESFRTVFWNDKDRFIHNVVRGTDLVADKTPSSPALVSAVLLENVVFTLAELRDILNFATKHLIVRRMPVVFGTSSEQDEPLPFGLVVKDSNERGRIYFGDEQYHARVMWPRDNPYLVGLAKLCGKGELVRGVLLNALDHQQAEGAVFYNQELFSLAEGQNPHHPPASASVRGAHNPIPVKNPVQYWSQFCDAFIKDYTFWTRQKKWVDEPIYMI